MLEDIVNLSAMRVREIMVPRVNVLRKPLDTGRRELLAEARKMEYSRILIYSGSDEDPLGYVRLNDLVADAGASGPLTPLLRPLVFVPETQRADLLLRRFTAENLELAAVVDEYGGLAGIVTVEDLLAEVVGDFEPVPLEEIEKLDETTCRLNGRLPIREWRELFTGFLPEDEAGHLAFDTIGGLIISLLGRMPKAGDRVFLRNLCLTVETMHQRHIGTVLLHLQTPEETP
jgi:putative hemolysin